MISYTTMSDAPVANQPVSGGEVILSVRYIYRYGARVNLWPLSRVSEIWLSNNPALAQSGEKIRAKDHGYQKDK